MATHTGHVMTLANSIIGVSVLAMPFCFKQCGIALGICMLALSSITSRLACHFLIKSSVMCRRRNFEFLALYVFGPSGKLLVELGVIGFMLGTCVAYFVVMGDLGPAIISKSFLIENNSTLRTCVLIGIGLLIVLPLGLLRNVESLAAVSTATIGFYLLLVIKILSESFPHLIAGDWIDHVNFWRTEGVLQCFPIFAMALSCQTQIFEIYESLPVPSLEKMNSVVRAAVNICTGVYVSVGLLGYIAFSAVNFSGNILLSFSPSFSSELYKLGFVMSIAVSFPLVIFPCRASLYSLLFRKMPVHHELTQSSSHIPDTRFKYLTVTIVMVSLCIGLLIPSIELVLGFVGSTIGVAICIIFPALAFINLTTKETNERLVAKAAVLIGVIIMVVGSYGNLYAAAENKSIEVAPVKSSAVQEMKFPPKIEINTEAVKNEVLEIAPIIEDKKPQVVAGDDIAPKVLLAKDLLDEKIRQEPPVPVEPPKKEPLLPPAPVIENVQKPEIEKVPDITPEKKEVEKAMKMDKVPEVINKDAIDKEERELQEVEKQRKSEEEKKKQELLEKLKEHQAEQKKLLKEQEKILMEMKNRENEKKQNEVVSEEKPLKPLIPEVKPIESKKFDENIEKIQSVIDDLKDTKQAIEKEKLESKPVESQVVDVPKENLEAKPLETSNKVDNLTLDKDAKLQEMKNKVASMPLPLAKLAIQANQNALNEESLKSKQGALGRDILGEKLVREKRDVEECHKEGTIKTVVESKTEASRSDDIIRNSIHLSVPEESKISDLGESKVGSEPKLMIAPKKRDLKSVEAAEDEKTMRRRR